MKRWFRMGYPPTWMCAVPIVLMLGLGACHFVWLMAYGADATRDFFRVAFQMCVLIAAISSVAMAGFRLTRFPENTYGDWLAQTPWTSNKRLPFGPWHPVWYDIIPLALLGVVPAGAIWIGSTIPGGLRSEMSPWIGLFLASVLFLSVWTLGGVVVVRKDWRWVELAGVAWMGGFLHFIRWPSLTPWLFTYSGLSLLGWTAFAWFAMNSRLKRFTDQHELNEMASTKHSQTAAIGTYGVLSPGHRPSVGWGPTAKKYRSTLGAILVALTSLVFSTLPNWEPVLLIACGAVPILCGLIATAFIAAGQCSHLNLFARWSRKRLIVPGYDVIWLYCLGIMIPGFLILQMGRDGFLPPHIAGPLCIAISLLLALRLHPGHRRWTLTAPCRYTLTRRKEKLVSS